MRIRKRHRLKMKEIRRLSEEISERVGVLVFGEGDTVDSGSAPDYDAIFVNGKVLALVFEEKPFLSVRGVLEYRAVKRFVTVDMGAVGFVCNGADIMGPGIIDADPGIEEGDLVWIRDEKNFKPLAIGKALVPGSEMLRKGKGKMVQSVTYVGDKLWKLDED
ncbi:MAG: RNA-binding protein [Thermoplasmata archaeon]